MQGRYGRKKRDESREDKRGLKRKKEEKECCMHAGVCANATQPTSTTATNLARPPRLDLFPMPPA